MTDIAMVRRLGSAALAATVIGSMIVWVLVSFGISLGTATQTVVARRLGQNKYSKCSTAMHNGSLLALLNSTPIILLGYLFSYKLIPLFLSDPEVISLCIEYTSLAFISVLFSSLCFVFQRFYTGIEKRLFI